MEQEHASGESRRNRPVLFVSLLVFLAVLLVIMVIIGTVAS